MFFRDHGAIFKYTVYVSILVEESDGLRDEAVIGPFSRRVQGEEGV